MHLRARAVGAIGVIVLAATAFAVTPQVASATSYVVGHVYVNDNTAGTNTIGAFDQHADGSLTPHAGLTVLRRWRRDRHDRRFAGFAPGHP